MLREFGYTRAAVAGAVFGAGLVASTSVFAGAFAVREQSAYFQGMSFAGAAAGHELSSMFWNSAAAAAAPGINSETHISLVVPHTDITATSGVFVDSPPFGLGMPAQSGDIGDPTPVPASYYNYQIDQQWFLGLAINGQYGFRTKPDNEGWAGSPFGVTSEVFSVNLNPVVAYKLTPELTIGAGVMVQYFDVRLRSGPNAAFAPASIPALPGRTTEGDDWGFGATAGVVWQPAPGTSIGVGYRSAIDVDLEGTCRGAGLSTVAAVPLGGPGSCGTGTAVTASFTLPEMITASFRQQVSETWAVLGSVEWTNWSRLGGTVFIRDNTGTIVDLLPLEYEDGWFVSGGVEYAYSVDTTLRAGVAWEKSPIEDDARRVILPDSDRIWLSVGLTHKLTERATIDIGYSHLFLDDAPICETEATGCALLQAEADGDIDIVSASFRYRWGGPAPELEPLK